MKKLIQSFVLAGIALLISDSVNAQLSSDKPALTGQQMQDMMQKRNAEAKASSVATAVSVSSDKPSLTEQQSKLLQQKPKAEVKAVNVVANAEAKQSIPSEAAGVKIIPASEQTVPATKIVEEPAKAPSEGPIEKTKNSSH